MKKTIGAVILGIVLISLVGAVDVFSGDSITLTLPEEYDYYSIVGNSTPIDLEIEQDGLNVTITIGKYTQSDVFTIVFIDNSTETIIKEVEVSGGESSKTIYKNVTEFVEVDNYIDREVIKEVEIEKDYPLEKKSFPWLMIVSGLGFVVLTTYLYFRWTLKRTVKTALENLGKENEE